VHRLFEADHRRAVEMPGQGVPGGAAGYNFGGEEGVQLLGGMEVDACRRGPIKAARCHADVHDV
jgi:hypothetical protein